ncbi:hypothetical protein R1sor_004354 [Riccia sorocarpa]|uniref:Uncharacterized protein n=1 Tax=Riccia sorocarpa TaxID=122646 RepID=A0ABD3HH40_9MARC
MPMPPVTHSKRNTRQEKEVKVVVPLHPKDKKYHIFQHHENDTERHALENWEWFENDRPILQESISRRINRPQEKLMMDQGSHYRLKMENQGIVDSVKRIEDMVRGEALWKMSLRNNWERHIECNGMHSTPKTWGPEARKKKEVERIGYPNKMDSKFVYFKDNSRRDRRRSLWNEFDWYIQHIVESIDKDHSFYPSFEGLQARFRSSIRPS